MIKLKKQLKILKVKLIENYYLLYGLAYKPNVNDIRESPINIVNNLMNKDYKVIAVEPNIESTKYSACKL